MTLFEAYKNGEAILRRSGIENAAFDAKQLLLHAFDISGKQYAAYKNEPCDYARLESYKRLCAQRGEGRPLQYLIGKWDFCGHEFIVGEGCLVPRPETELVVKAALSLDLGGAYFADLCTGSGCIGISYSLEAPNSHGLLLDISDAALSYTEKNIIHTGASPSRISAQKFDVLTDSLPEGIELLMSNPPYISNADMLSLQREVLFEPKEALCGGEDGLCFYRAIADRHIKTLTCNAYIILEIGFGEEKAVRNIIEASGCVIVDVKKDAAGIDRTIIARKK